jgi:hypothetical protein
MTDIIEKVFAFNQDAGLLDKPYDDFLESSFQIEEALEGFSNLELSKVFWGSESTDISPKNLSREIVAHAQGEGFSEPLTDVGRFDKHIDSMIYDLGALAKLGLSPSDIVEGIEAVNEANLTKLQCKKDEHGKLGKPTNFVGPESILQSILDRR